MSTDTDLLRRVRDRLATQPDPRDAELLAELDAALAEKLDWRETRVGRPRRTHYRADVGLFNLTVFHHTGGGWEWRLSAVGTADSLDTAKLAAEAAAGVRR